MIVPPKNQSMVVKLWSEFKDLTDRSMREDRAAGGAGDDEEGHGEAFVHPFAGLDLMSVLLDCRAFHDAGFVRMHPKRCCQQLAKLLWFIGQGVELNGPEAVDVFFGVTKLFQSPDGNLRRMVYLFLRSVADSTDASSLIIVTQSLVKDMFTDVALYKGNALRVLGAIVDTSMLGQLERYFKTMLVDKDDYVASTALTTSLLLVNRPGAVDTIGRWSSEVQAVLTSRGDMVQFHALALLRSIKRHDRLAVSKVVHTLMRSGMRSPLGLCLLIRYAVGLLEADASAVNVPSLLEFLDACLRNKSEMVLLEAAKALVALPVPGGLMALGGDLTPAITMLHMFLTSPKPANRFAAVRALHALSGTHPAVVSKANEDLEALVSDRNTTVATLAITTLLKTGGEAAVDRLMKSLGPFLAETHNDESKVTVVQAIHDLALRIPGKHRSIMAFLANALREEGGYDYKKAILDALMEIMTVIPDAMNEGLLLLCEFIEDCEYTALATRVLHLLGDAGPSAPNPAGFIRFIYNRVILEAAPVRASAVTALAKFATRVPDLRESILPLLQRCLDDDDDEVRDRATMYLVMLGGRPTVTGTLSAAAAAAAAADAPAAAAFEPSIASALTGGRLPLPVPSLTKALTLYMMRPGKGPLSFGALPHVDVPAATAAAAGSGASSASAAAAAAGGAASTASGPAVPGLEGYGYSTEIRAAEASAAHAKAARARERLAAPVGGAGTGGAASAAAGGSGSAAGGGASAAAGGGATAAGGASAAGSSGIDTSAAEALYRVPEFASYGPLFRSLAPVELTERELEYLASVTKHVFANHVVLQFTIRNTVPEVQLERCAVQVLCSDRHAYTPVASIAAKVVREGHPATAYVALARNPEAGIVGARFTCELRFGVREVDPSTGEALGDVSPEVYPVDGFEVGLPDFTAPVPVGDFRGAWEALAPGGGVDGASELIESLALPSHKAVPDAVAAVVGTLGLAPCEGTGTVKPGVPKHNAYLSGVFLGGFKVLVRMQVSVDADGTSGGGCVLKLGVRSDNADVAQLFMDVVSS